MAKTNPTKVAWAKRRARVRRKVKGTAVRPRLTVSRTLNHIYAQIINDEIGATLASANTMDKNLRAESGHNGNVAAAKLVGATIAQACRAIGITRVVFDRNGYLYHGRVKALAEAAREAGLQF